MLQAPFFVLGRHGEISVYADESDLITDLEAVDVKNGEYEAFDSQGKVIALEARIFVQKRPWYFGGATSREVVVIHETQETLGEERLRSILNEALDLLPHPPEKRPSETPALVELAVKLFGYSLR